MEIISNTAMRKARGSAFDSFDVHACKLKSAMMFCGQVEVDKKIATG